MQWIEKLKKSESCVTEKHEFIEGDIMKIQFQNEWKYIGNNFYDINLICLSYYFAVGYHVFAISILGFSIQLVIDKSKKFWKVKTLK